MGSVVEYLGQNHPELLATGGRIARHSAAHLPNYVVAPNFLGKLQEYSVQLRRPGEYAGWLGRGYDPLTTNINKRDKKDNPYFRDCTDDELHYQIQGLAYPLTSRSTACNIGGVCWLSWTSRWQPLKNTTCSPLSTNSRPAFFAGYSAGNQRRSTFVRSPMHSVIAMAAICSDNQSCCAAAGRSRSPLCHGPF